MYELRKIQRRDDKYPELGLSGKRIMLEKEIDDMLYNILFPHLELFK